MLPDQEKLIAIDISFDLFLEGFEKESVRSSLTFLLNLSGSLTETQYSTFKQDMDQSFLSEFGITPEQGTTFLEMCEKYRTRYKAHKTVFTIMQNIGTYGFLYKIENISTRNQLHAFLSICGEINNDVFTSITSSEKLSEFGLSGEDITEFRQISNSFREQYLQNNLFTEHSTRRDGFQYTYRILESI